MYFTLNWYTAHTNGILDLYRMHACNGTSMNTPPRIPIGNFVLQMFATLRWYLPGHRESIYIYIERTKFDTPGTDMFHFNIIFPPAREAAAYMQKLFSILEFMFVLHMFRNSNSFFFRPVYTRSYKVGLLQYVFKN